MADQGQTTAISAFEFSDLLVERLIIHAVHARRADKTIADPKFSEKVITLVSETRDVLKRRITEALGSRSHGIELSIEKVEADSFFQCAAALISGDENLFVAGSKKMANKLTDAQKTTSAPPGRLAVCAGRVGSLGQKFIAVLKAETQDGFAETHSEEADIQYIQNLFLTSNQRLYKVGMLVDLNARPAQDDCDFVASDYRAFLFDQLLTSTESRNAAAYFYDAFLGMGINKSAKKLTQDFLEYSRLFINGLSVDQESRKDLLEALRVELRSQKTTIQPANFAKEHLTPTQAKEFREFLDAKGFPKNAVVKDVDYVKSKLKAPRKIVFDTDVRISIPTHAAQDVVVIGAASDGFTMVKIQGRVREQS